MSPVKRKTLLAALLLAAWAWGLAQTPPDPLNQVATLAKLESSEVEQALKKAFPKGTNIQQSAERDFWTVQTAGYMLHILVDGPKVIEVVVTFIRPVDEKGLLPRLGMPETPPSARPPQTLRWEKVVPGVDYISATTVGSTAPSVKSVLVVADKMAWDKYKETNL